MKIYICQVCGHLEFNNLPDKCPVCGAEKIILQMMRFLKNPAKRVLKLKLNTFLLSLLMMRFAALFRNPVAWTLLQKLAR